MKRFLRGAVLLAVTAVLAGCSTEPEALADGEPDHIVAEPGAIIVNAGDSIAVKLRLVDAQGTSLHEPISVSAGTGITVTADSLYRPIFHGDTLVFNPTTTELRVTVAGNALTKTSFDVSAGGKTLNVPVTVTPATMDVEVSTATPDIATPVTITAPAGVTFGPSATMVDATGATIGYVTGFSTDNTAITVDPIPGKVFAGFTLTDVRLAYSPTLVLTVPTVDTLTLSATVGAGLTGTDDIATAPELLVSPGVDRGFVDKGTFAGVDPGGDLDGGVQYYKLVVPADGTYDFSVTFPGGKDVGIFLFDESGASLGAIADDFGTGGDSESASDVDITAGTYFVGVGYFDYGSELAPEYFALTVHQH
ncbi:MAG TPA: PPC domain-containing protein [Gemmatimonadales bacterium]|jgi:hypothetical protein|nr:PPC domain-containing protein [Gemmatimonadales bacterium]